MLEQIDPIKVAADHDAKPADLVRLLKLGIPEVDRKLAGNPAMPMKQLCDLAYNWPVEFLDNPVVFLWSLQGAQIHVDISLIELAARYREWIEAGGSLENGPAVSTNDRFRLAKVGEESPGLLPFLLRDPDPLVRVLAISQLTTALLLQYVPLGYIALLEPVFDVLMNDPEEEVRLYLPKIRRLGEARLLRLAQQDPSALVQLSIAGIP